MKSDMAFCDHCMDDVAYSIKQEKQTDIIKNKKYAYTAKIPVCKKCGAQLYVPQLHDANLEALYNEYRKQNGIVSLDKVRAIPKMYNIGKRPLSNLLGGGEITYTRYIDGDIPSSQYSKIIEKMHDDPGYYLQLLEENKNNIPKTAYTKSLNACKKLLRDAINKDKKINQVTLYILYRYSEISKKSVQKLLYYIQGFSKAFNGKFIFSEDCEAGTHGPVFKQIYEKFESYKLNETENLPYFDANIFSTEDFNVIEGVLASLGIYNGNILEGITHHETPGLEARKGLNINERSSSVIKRQTIAKYFNDVKNKYKMLSPMDIKEYAQSAISVCNV